MSDNQLEVFGPLYVMMSNEERARRLVGDMPWVTEHLSQEQIDDMIAQVKVSMDAAVWFSQQPKPLTPKQLRRMSAGD